MKKGVIPNKAVCAVDVSLYDCTSSIKTVRVCSRCVSGMKSMGVGETKSS